MSGHDINTGWGVDSREYLKLLYQLYCLYYLL